MCRSFWGGGSPAFITPPFLSFDSFRHFLVHFFLFAKGIIGHQVSLFSFDLSRSLVWSGLV